MILLDFCGYGKKEQKIRSEKSKCRKFNKLIKSSPKIWIFLRKCSIMDMIIEVFYKSFVCIDEVYVIFEGQETHSG